MTTRIVRTQEEFNKAIADQVKLIEIRSEPSVTIEVRTNDSSTVTACDSSRVEAWGSSKVRAWDSSKVRAYGSSTVTACDSSTVMAWDSSKVRAYGSSTVTACDSSTVMACDSSRVEAYGSSTVRAYDSSTVMAYGSSTVTASGSSTVWAYESSTVRASGSSTVTACDSSTVWAYDSVAVHLHDSTVHLTGGVVIDHTKVAIFDAKEWCTYHGVKVEHGIATVYKAVDNNWTTSRGFDYSPGSLTTCNDFRADNSCGGGLHFGPTPVHALAYFREATKFVAIGVKVDELQPIFKRGCTAKCEAPRVVVAAVEVDIDGKEVVDV